MLEASRMQGGQSESKTLVSIGKAGLRAGLLGAVGMTLFGLLNVFGPQILRLVTCGLLFALLVVVGVFASYLLGPMRTGRRGAGAGALAGLFAAIGGAIGLAALPLDPLFSQNMEVLCASTGGCGLWVGATGIAIAFILSFLLLLVPAIGLSTLAGAIYGGKKGARTARDDKDPATEPDALFEESVSESIDAREHTAPQLHPTWRILNLGAAILLMIVLGLLGAGQVFFIFQHGSIPSGGLLLVGTLAGFLWLAVMVSVILWYRTHPFRLWLGVILWPLLFFVMLVGVCPSCKWAERRIVQGDSAVVYSRIQFSGYAQIVATGSGTIWASDVYYDTVKVIDQQSEQEVGTVPVGTNPIGVAVDDDAIWVVSEGNNTIYRIDPQQLTVVATIPVSSPPLLATTGAGSIWVTLPQKDQVVRIDPVQNKVETIISVGDNPSGLAAYEHYIWVANMDDNTVTRIDAITNQIDATIEVGSSPTSVVAHNNAIWVANNGDDFISRIDPIEREVVAEIPVGSGPMALAGGEDLIWVTLIDENAVVRIDAKSNQVVGDPIPVGERPMGIASDNTGVWVAEFGDGSLGRIETDKEATVSQASAYQISSAYLVSIYSFLGGVAVSAFLGFFVWVTLVVLGSLIGRLTDRHRWLAYGIVWAMGLAMAWLVFRLTSSELAVGVVAGTISASVVLWLVRQPDLEKRKAIEPL